MAQDEQYIYLGYPDNFKKPDDLPVLKSMPGCAAVQIVDCSFINGVHYVPEQGRFRLQRDMGWVVGVGEGVELTHGDLVIVRGYSGLWDESIRHYGIGYPDYDNRYPWWDEIPATIENGTPPTLKPHNDWVQVEFDELFSFVEQLNEVYYSSGTVVAIGPSVKTVQVGEKVEVKNGHPRNLDFKMDWAKASWGFVPESTVVGRYEEKLKA